MGEIEPVTVDLPEEWNWEGEFEIRRDRPKRGTPTYMSVATMPGDGESELCYKYYVIKEGFTGAKILAKTNSKKKARKQMVEAAIDHY